MSDYRNANFHYWNPDDWFGHGAGGDRKVRAADSGWGWIAAALVLALIVAAAFGVGHRPGQGGTNLASIGPMPPASSRMMPTTVLPQAATPTPTATPIPPIAPAPSAPPVRSGTP